MEFEGRARIDSKLEMTPLIDVVFLLLVFFMLTTTFLRPEALDLSLPEAATATASEEQTIVVAIEESGRIVVNGRDAMLDDVSSTVRNLLDAGASKTITLKADENIAVKQMVEVMDALRTAGGTDIDLATRPR